MARFEVTISEMQNAASKIAQAASDFLDTANAVNQAAQALSSTWEGDSQVAFQEEQTKANEWYNKMVEIVNTYVDNLTKTAQKYSEADEQATAAIKSR